MRDELQRLEAYLTLLKDVESTLGQADSKDPKRFAPVLEQAMIFLNLQPKEIAEEFGTSEASVSRWRQARNTPYPAIRKLVYDGLRRRAILAVRAAEARAANIRAVLSDGTGTSGTSEKRSGLEDRRTRPAAQ